MLPLSLWLSGSLLFACAKRSNQEKHTHRARSPGILPCDFAIALRGSQTAHPCAGCELARILRAIAARLLLRALAAPGRDPGAAHIPCAQTQRLYNFALFGIVEAQGA